MKFCPFDYARAWELDGIGGKIEQIRIAGFLVRGRWNGADIAHDYVLLVYIAPLLVHLIAGINTFPS